MLMLYNTDMAENKDYYSFDLKFDGQLVENSADAFDVANTIIAVSATVQQMLSIRYGDEAGKLLSLNINAFQKGSLVTKFFAFLADPSQADQNIQLFGLSALTAQEAARNAITMVGTYVKVRKALQGKKPKNIVAQPGGDRYDIHLHDNSVLTINHYDYKALQDKTVAKNMDKAVAPLEKEGSELEDLSIITHDKKVDPIVVNKAEAKYVKRGDEELQKIDNMRLKGVVTKIDTKVRSGYLNLGGTARRVSFTYSRKLSIEQFDILINSLHTQVQIYLEGVVESDMEGKPISIDIVAVEQDEKLL